MRRSSARSGAPQWRPFAAQLRVLAVATALPRPPRANATRSWTPHPSRARAPLAPDLIRSEPLA